MLNKNSEIGSPSGRSLFSKKFSASVWKDVPRVVAAFVILSAVSFKPISLRTFESHIADSLTDVQNKYQDVEIGSYPFFQAGKLGVSIVMRSDDQNLINKCSSDVMSFVNDKKIEVVERD